MHEHTPAVYAGSDISTSWLTLVIVCLFFIIAILVSVVLICI